MVDSDVSDDDDNNILQDSGSDYEDELKKDKAKHGNFVGSDSESEDESKKQKPETSKVSPTPKTYSGKKGEKVVLSWPRGRDDLAKSVDDLPCAPDDKDLNTPYQCDSCDKTIKGKVIDVGSYTFGNPFIFKRSSLIIGFLGCFA